MGSLDFVGGISAFTENLTKGMDIQIDSMVDRDTEKEDDIDYIVRTPAITPMGDTKSSINKSIIRPTDSPKHRPKTKNLLSTPSKRRSVTIKRKTKSVTKGRREENTAKLKIIRHTKGGSPKVKLFLDRMIIMII